MRGPGRRTGHTAFLALATAVLAVTVLVVPAASSASGHADRLSGPVSRALPPDGPSSANRPFSGVAAVGALFTADPRTGKLGSHFCTASVVHSPKGDLAVSAAHCLTEQPGPVVFVPGYDRGAAPYGRWRVTGVFMPQAWKAMQDPDDDVAFLRLAPAPDGVPVEDVTGAEQLGTTGGSRTYVQVMGYPDPSDQPVWCANWTNRFSPTQLEFDCGGYETGTSGSPFLSGVSRQTGQGTVIGVIGGYQAGGYTASVSYSVAFGPSVAGLYRSAVAGS